MNWHRSIFFIRSLLEITVFLERSSTLVALKRGNLQIVMDAIMAMTSPSSPPPPWNKEAKIPVFHHHLTEFPCFSILYHSDYSIIFVCTFASTENGSGLVEFAIATVGGHPEGWRHESQGTLGRWRWLRRTIQFRQSSATCTLSLCRTWQFRSRYVLFLSLIYAKENQGNFHINRLALAHGKT